KRASVASTSAWIEAGSRMSVGRTSVWVPEASSSAASARNRFSRRAASASRAPARAQARAVASPRPLEAPVIRVIRSLSGRCCITAANVTAREEERQAELIYQRSAPGRYRKRNPCKEIDGAEETLPKTI